MQLTQLTNMNSEEENQTLLALVMRYLRDTGYEQTCTTLMTESAISLEQVKVEEAASLSNVLKDYEALYMDKHGRPPVLAADPGGSQALRLRPESIVGTTKLFGTTTAVSQVDFFRVVCANRSFDPTSLFYIELPLSCARRFRPSQLTLTPLQENILYGLVGCADVGWRLSSVSQNSRAILEEKYGINKRTLQLFFKNRCQQKTRRKRSRTKSDLKTEDLEQSDLLEGYIPIAPAPTSTDMMHVNSLLEMVKGEEFDGGMEQQASLIDQSTLEAYQPSAHITQSMPTQLP